MRRAAVLLLAAFCLLALTGSAGATITLPSGFIDTTVADGLSSSTSMVWDPASARLFVTQQNGDLRVVKGGKLLRTPAISLNVDDNGERGLLGVELDPSFSTNHYIYLYYTVSGSQAHNRLSRFTMTGDVINSNPTTEHVLVDFDNLSPTATNHNGGAIHFGSDGKLYVAHGDNANSSNSQSMNTLLGKVLRLNSDGTIPSDNPFYGSATGKYRMIWALGFRNPFTFAVQPTTGTMFVNDVGESTYEEINVGAAGANYGWPVEEGPADPPDATYTDPLYYYAHNGSPSPNGCAITGGTFYNPPVAYFPAQYVGHYFFSDWCSSWIRQLDGAADSDFATGGNSPVDLDTGPDGSLYYLEQGGRVGRISYESTPTVDDATPSSASVGDRVEIDGTYLADATAVTFNGTPATFAVVWDTRLIATVPAGATTGKIEVTTGDGTALSANDFTVTPVPPAITSFSPTKGVPGKTVTITGALLTGVTLTTFNGVAAQSFTVKTDKKITAVVPVGSSTGPIEVTTPDGVADSVGDFVVPPPPSVTNFTPTSGPTGTKITITGTAFKGTKTLTINGMKVSRSIKSDMTIVATVKKGTTSGQITVTGPAGSDTSAGTFTVT